MDKYILDWLKVIDGIKNDNTYKASWGKAIIECLRVLKNRKVLNNLKADEPIVTYPTRFFLSLYSNLFP